MESKDALKEGAQKVKEQINIAIEFKSSKDVVEEYLLIQQLLIQYFSLIKHSINRSKGEKFILKFTDKVLLNSEKTIIIVPTITYTNNFRRLANIAQNIINKNLFIIQDALNNIAIMMPASESRCLNPTESLQHNDGPVKILGR